MHYFYFWILLLALLSGYGLCSCPPKEYIQKGLVFGNGTFISDTELKYMGSAALPGLQLDPFCETMMRAFITFEEGESDNPLLKEYFDFIFDDFEHEMQSFDEDASSTWEFLFNQSFLQYSRIPENKLKSDYILNKTIIPAFPFLKMVEYEADVKDIKMDDDFTGHFNEISTRTFANELRRVLRDVGNKFNVTKFKVLIYSALKALKQRNPKLSPYGYFLLNVPIDFVKNLSIETPWNRTDFTEFFIYTAEELFEQIEWYDKYLAHDLLSEMVPEEISENRPVPSESIFSRASVYHEVMKYYGDVEQELFIEKYPLSEDLIEAVRNEDLKSILLIGNVLNEFNLDQIQLILSAAVQKGNTRILDFIIRNNDHDIFKDAVYDASIYGKKEVMEFLMNSERGAAGHFSFGMIFFDFVKEGWYDLAEEVLSADYSLCVDAKALPLLIENGQENLLEKIIGRIGLDSSDARQLFGKAGGRGNIHLMYLISKTFKIDISDPFLLSEAIRNGHLAVVKEFVHLYQWTGLEYLANNLAESDEMREYLLEAAKKKKNNK